MTDTTNKVKRKNFGLKRKRKPVQEVEFNIDELKKDILQETKSLKINAKSAEVMAEKIVEKTAKWAEKRVTFTQGDLHKRIAEEAKKYSEDLAYVYQNRDKII